MKGKPCTLFELSEIDRLSLLGWADAGIAYRLGLVRETVQRRRTTKVRIGNKEEILCEDVAVLIREGESVNDIAGALDIHLNSVTNIRKQCGISSEQRKFYRRKRVALEVALARHYIKESSPHEHT